MHFTGTLTIKRVDDGPGGETARGRVTDLANITVRADSLDSLVRKVHGHLELVDDDRSAKRLPREVLEEGRLGR